MRVLGADERRELTELDELVQRAGHAGLAEFDTRALDRLPALYRRASTLHVELASGVHDASELALLSRTLARAHALVYAPGKGPARAALWRRALKLLCEDSPRAIRQEWKLVGGILIAFYAVASAAFCAVHADLSQAWALLDDSAVAATIEQLEGAAPGERFRGNFTFGLGESPRVAGQIFAHNIAVSVLFFGSGLLPPLFALLLGTNALMVGAYTALAAHWNQGLAISSILWCHGVIELQMIVLSGAAGLVLVRAWIAPGPYTRRHAMRRESRRAALLFAPVAPFLVISGFIEGFVSPHAPPPVALGVALATGLLLTVWVTRGGRAA